MTFAEIIFCASVNLEQSAMVLILFCSYQLIKDKITQLEVYFYTNFNSKRPINLNHVRVVFELLQLWA